MNLNTDESSGFLAPFRTGFLSSLLAFSGLTAASWFFRSESWGNLCGYTKNFYGEAIGFPFEFWRIDQSYHGGWLLNFPNLFLNLGIALAVGAVLSLVFRRYQSWIRQRINSHQPVYSSPKPVMGSATFSVRGLLFITTVLAGSFAALQRMGASSELLAVIVFGGPALLLLIAMFPTGLSWDRRAWIIVGTAGLLMSAAIAIGHNLSMPFDRVLFGIFISWVPQSVAGAGFMTCLLLLRQPVAN